MARNGEGQFVRFVLGAIGTKIGKNIGTFCGCIVTNTYV